MGCWGITAFESDAGLDAVGFIRSVLPENGKLKLESIIAAMHVDKNAQWYIPAVEDGDSHTGPMALAEIMAKYLDGDAGDMDYDEEWAARDNKFKDVTSFTTDKSSIRWPRGYVSDTFDAAIKNAEYRAQHGTGEWDQRNGWRENEDWQGWKDHMAGLVSRMDGLLALPDSRIELIKPREQTQNPVMGQTFQ